MTTPSTGPYSAIFGAVRQKLIDNSGTSFTPNLTTENVLMGLEHVNENNAFFRVVFVPSDGDLEPSQHEGYNPNQLYRFFLPFDVYCWGDNWDGAFNLMQAVIQAAHSLAGGGGMRAKKVQANFKGNASVATAGRFMKFKLSINSSVVDYQQPTKAPPTSAEFSTQVDH